MSVLFLILSASLLTESAISIGKAAVARRIESIYGMGFLGLFWASLFMAVTLFFGADFRFNLASLPTFLPRLGFELLIAYFGVLTVTRVDRSTAGFLSLVTIPLLLGVDLALGYAVTAAQMIGVIIIFGALTLLFGAHAINRRGGKYVIIWSLGAVVTTSLYKYDITHYNSVVAEQLITYLVLIAFFSCMAWVTSRENTWTYLRRPLPESQSFLEGIGSVMMSFAYTLAPPSIVVAIKRAATLLWAILFGNVVFHERKILLKLASYGVVLIGMLVMTGVMR